MSIVKLQLSVPTVAPQVEEKLHDMVLKPGTMDVRGVGQDQFEVFEEENYGEVDLIKKVCTCDRFQLLGIPSVHAIAGALKHRISVYTLYSLYYTVGS